MVCPCCGHKKGLEWNGETSQMEEVNPGGEDFVPINGHFTTESHGGFYYGNIIKTVSIFACPHCSVVIMNNN